MASNRYCAKCGYELTSRKTKKCPDCGAKFCKEKQMSKAKRNRNRASSERDISVIGFQFLLAIIGGIISLVLFFISGKADFNDVLIYVVIGLILGWIVALLTILVLVSIRSIKGTTRDISHTAKSLTRNFGLPKAILFIVAPILLFVISYLILLATGSSVFLVWR